ncbi:hypothetical protein EDD21DRAFT_179622 [Dissophora ornata]|nr:hypothetical protein EDD21DRAFT_179622 [Dissophora ornata]
MTDSSDSAPLVSSGLPSPAFTTTTRTDLVTAASDVVIRPDQLDEHTDGSYGRIDITYKILYLKLHGMAATARILLAIGGVRWESIYPNNWSAEKGQVPLGVMPVLYETHHCSHDSATASSEQEQRRRQQRRRQQRQDLVLEIPESEAIERYLARKFSLLGRDAWEETAINVFYCSSNAVMSLYVNKVLLAFPDTKSRELEKFVNKNVKDWIVQHEKWLERNGSNGFYVGNQLSLADIRSVVCLDRFMTISECKDMFSAAHTPGLLKLKQNLESIPRYAAWIASAEFEDINISTRQRLALLSG